MPPTSLVFLITRPLERLDFSRLQFVDLLISGVIYRGPPLNREVLRFFRFFGLRPLGCFKEAFRAPVKAGGPAAFLRIKAARTPPT